MHAMRQRPPLRLPLYFLEVQASARDDSNGLARRSGRLYGKSARLCGMLLPSSFS